MISGPTRGATEAPSGRWTERPRWAFLLRALAVLVPFLGAWLAIRLVSGFLVRPPGTYGLILWIIQAASFGTAISVLIDHFTRRLLPLAMLYNLGLVFPDRAPSRFRLAMRTGTVRQRRARLTDLRREGLGSDATAAAQRAIELIAMLGEHDRRTCGHTQRVRAYADMIGEEMGLSDEDRDCLGWAALLHDVGKMTVPSEILNSRRRPGGLDWEILKEHPISGDELLEPLNGWLGDWSLAAAEHHERWDGDGYPRRLTGDQISLSGRICAVADAYDVITSPRSYKQPMSARSARQEMVRSSGTQFDPQVVRALLGVSLGRNWLFGSFAWLLELPNAIGMAPTAPIAPAVLGSVLIAGTLGLGPPSAGTTATAPDLLTLQPEAPMLEAAPTIEIVTTTTALTTSDPTTTGPTTSTTSGSSTSSSSSTTSSSWAETSPATADPGAALAVDDLDWAVDDLELGDTGSNINVWALDNDETSAGLDHPTLRIVTDPGHGLATVFAPPGNPKNTRIRYRSSADFRGTDSFVYEVCDLDGDCATATVQIIVGA